jgi:hypothetical protein
MDRDEITNLYRGPSIDSYQVLVQLAKQLQGRRFLEIDQSETRIVCGGHVCKRIGTKSTISIEDLPLMLPTKFRFIWQSGFRGKDLTKSTNQKQEWPVVAIFVKESGRNEQTL